MFYANSDRKALLLHSYIFVGKQIKDISCAVSYSEDDIIGRYYVLLSVFFVNRRFHTIVFTF